MRKFLPLASSESFRFRKMWAAMAFLPLGLMLPSVASASTDTYGTGDGHTGAVSVTAVNTIVNSYSQLATAVIKGAKTIDIKSPTGFAKGDLILVIELNGYAKPASGTPGPFDLSAAQVGRFELARVTDIAAGKLTLDGGMVNAYSASTAQVIKVPEYTTVNVATGSSIVPKAWDGFTGGIVAFLANGVVTITGRIDASGKGYRGGEYVVNPGPGGCVGLDEPSPNGAGKGEGITSVYGVSVSGRGNLANGAGGAVCRDSGGAGGGNGGAGGRGGRTGNGDGSRAVGGLGGAALKYSLLDHITLGGGGGGGAGNAGTATPGTAGGGAIWIRASSVAGAGVIAANGLSQTTGAGFDGCGGGGAGGSVYIRVIGAAACGSIQVNGGNGGSSTGNYRGPGGGGGGGRAMLQAASGVCPIEVKSGVAGKQPINNASLGGLEYGAEPVPGETLYYGTTEKAPTGGYCGVDANCATGKVCDVAAGVCVECRSTADCSGGKVCAAATKTCTTCKADSECTTTGLSKCDLAAGAVCVGCLADTDCGTVTSGKVCEAKACKDGCRGALGNGCPTGLTCSSATSAAGTCSSPPVDAGVDTGPADTGAVDTGVVDTGPEDTGVDTGAADTGTADTGTGDTGPADTGPADTGTAVDEGIDSTITDTGVVPDTSVDPDTAVPDTAVTDTGSGSSDTGVASDTGTAAEDTGGAAPPGDTGDSGGCSVPNAPSSSGTATLAALGLVAALGMRRRRK